VNRILDRGAVTAAFVGIGMAVTMAISFLLVIPIDPVYLYLAVPAGALIGYYANARSARRRGEWRRLLPNAAFAVLVARLSVRVLMPGQRGGDEPPRCLRIDPALLHDDLSANLMGMPFAADADVGCVLIGTRLVELRAQVASFGHGDSNPCLLAEIQVHMSGSVSGGIYPCDFFASVDRYGRRPEIAVGDLDGRRD